MSLVLAIDIGTGSCRCGLYNQELQRLSYTTVEYSTRYPQSSWAEQDPEMVFTSIVTAIEQTLTQSEHEPSAISAVTLDCQLHTILGLAKDKSPVTPVLTWEDSRAWELVEGWKQREIGFDIYAVTGCPLHPMYPSAKIAWWKENRPDLFDRVEKFVSLKAFVMYRLTGELLDDQATASGSGLLNINHLDWDDRVLTLSGITRQRLSLVVLPTYQSKGIRQNIGVRTGLPTSTPVIIGSSDAAMSSLGSGTLQPDQMTVMIGTSGALRRLTDRPTFDPQNRTFCYYSGNGFWFSGGAINNGGLVLRWFRDNFGEKAKREAQKRNESTYAILGEYAAKAAPGSDGLLFLPFLAGERSPYWNGKMRGILLGLSLHHKQSHIIRALMEGVCYRVLSVSDSLDQLMGIPQEVRVTGGFSRSPLWLQILSNVLNRDLLVLKEPEGSVLGAAAFAFHTLGMLDSFSFLQDKNPVSKIVKPDPKLHLVYKDGFEKYMRIYWKMREEFGPTETPV